MNVWRFATNFAEEKYKPATVEPAAATNKQISKEIIEEEQPWRRSASLRTLRQQQPDSPTRSSKYSRQKRVARCSDSNECVSCSFFVALPASPEIETPAPAQPTAVAATAAAATPTAARGVAPAPAAPDSEVILRRTQSFENDEKYVNYSSWFFVVFSMFDVECGMCVYVLYTTPHIRIWLHAWQPHNP